MTQRTRKGTAPQVRGHLIRLNSMALTVIGAARLSTTRAITLASPFPRSLPLSLSLLGGEAKDEVAPRALHGLKELARTGSRWHSPLTPPVSHRLLAPLLLLFLPFLLILNSTRSYFGYRYRTTPRYMANFGQGTTVPGTPHAG